MHPRQSVALEMAACLLLVACGGGGGAGPAAMPPPPPPPTSTVPSISIQPSDQNVSVGQPATFTVAATSTAALSYQWQKDAAAIAGATAASYTTGATAAADGGSSFAVVVSNSSGSATSRSAKLTVTNGPVPPGTDVVTYKNDLGRSGQNLSESTLTAANVAASSFGLLRNLQVDGKVDAQPLYISQLRIQGSAHNVVFVATEHDSVYAFDADTGSMLWRVSLLAAGESLSDARGCSQVSPEIGVTSTPVIDRTAGTNGTLYVVAMSKDASSKYHQRLHALDLVTGAELQSGPAEIQATYPSAGCVSTTFEPG